MNVIHFIRRQLDKLATSPGMLRIGKWRVRYYDGNWSRPMTYDVCKDYAVMHGGTVHHIRYNDPSRVIK